MKNCSLGVKQQFLTHVKTIINYSNVERLFSKSSI